MNTVFSLLACVLGLWTGRFHYTKRVRSRKRREDKGHAVKIDRQTCLSYFPSVAFAYLERLLFYAQDWEA